MGPAAYPAAVPSASNTNGSCRSRCPSPAPGFPARSGPGNRGGCHRRRGIPPLRLPMAWVSSCEPCTGLRNPAGCSWEWPYSGPFRSHPCDWWYRPPPGRAATFAATCVPQWGSEGAILAPRAIHAPSGGSYPSTRAPRRGCSTACHLPLVRRISPGRPAGEHHEPEGARRPRCRKPLED